MREVSNRPRRTVCSLSCLSHDGKVAYFRGLCLYWRLSKLQGELLSTPRALATVKTMQFFFSPDTKRDRLGSLYWGRGPPCGQACQSLLILAPMFNQWWCSYTNRFFFLHIPVFLYTRKWTNYALCSKHEYTVHEVYSICRYTVSVGL